MPRNVIFAAPFPAETTLRFIRAVSRLDDVRLLGIAQQPPQGEDAKLFHDIVRVTDPLSVDDVLDATEVLKRRHGKPYRILGVLEALQVQLAIARAKHGVDGTPPGTAELFRDKSRMKAALSKAGLPVARNALIRGEDDARRFAEVVGFPMVVKPPAGMGAKATFRVSSLDALLGAARGMRASDANPLLAEEFLRGREFSFETVTIGGDVKVDSISHYLPSCLEALENDWVQWCCMLPREITGPEYDGARKMGHAAVRALGLDDGMTHMEWFQRPDGSLVIGEIAQRPPGANITRMMGLACDIDPYRAWARAVVDGELDAPWNRRWAVGCAFLRGMGRGRVAGVTGVAKTHEMLGKWIAEANLPTLGAMKQDTYEGDGYVIVRDESTDVVKGLLKTIVDTMRVHYA